ncbi:MAG TPA: TIGR02530 family flagellar biosynthesis protein [Geobacteraceae bacterium]
MIEGVFLPTPLKGGARPESPARPAASNAGGSGFAGLLDAKLSSSSGVKFSGHALERLKTRGINLGETELRKLEGAVANVAAKGGKESLIMVGEAALVVSVKNRTVITAFDRRNLDGNVFTNIDSAAIL